MRLQVASRRQHVSVDSPKTRVLIVGAGEAGSRVAHDMLHNPHAGLLPVGFLDDDAQKRGTRLLGLPVLAETGHMAQVASATGAAMVLIALPAADGQVVRRLVGLARAAGLDYRIVPGLSTVLGAPSPLDQIRPVRVEDLLRRSPAHLDLSRIAGYLEGQTVLVTGAGGSIGSEIVRQVARFRPGRLVLVGRGENSIFQIQQEMTRHVPEVECTAVIANVRDGTRMRQVFARHRPTVVFHAAAHKHVPLMEDSPGEAVLNNVLGTLTLASLCLDFGVLRFVNISTDKAVNPTSVMGSTKRIAEMIVAGLVGRAGPEQVFVSVRFGNVLGSRGSVVPTFLNQIRSGGPVTVTHPEMTRYFMTIPEAARLVLEAGGLGRTGNVYVLKMGQPVRIVDLASDVIHLSGAHHVDIVFSGIRPGEKLFEELLTESEHVQCTTHEEIFEARVTQPGPAQLHRQVGELIRRAELGDDGGTRQLLREMIPESHLNISA